MRAAGFVTAETTVTKIRLGSVEANVGVTLRESRIWLAVLEAVPWPSGPAADLGAFRTAYSNAI
jgi:hypothetical protein